MYLFFKSKYKKEYIYILLTQKGLLTFYLHNILNTSTFYTESHGLGVSVWDLFPCFKSEQRVNNYLYIYIIQPNYKHNTSYLCSI